MNQTYTVKPGDTLYGISNQFGVSVVELANLNNVTANTLKVGQVLTIPSKYGSNPNNMFMYTVQKGDTLYKIAQKYNTTYQDIIKLNNLTNNNLFIGQVIRIPETYTKEDEMYLPSFINYVVKKGDNLYSIARNNGIDVDTIIKDNGLMGPNLSLGQVLRIRIMSDNNEELEQCFGPDYTPPQSLESKDNVINYVVKKGDNLYSIANKYNTSVSNIIKINNLKNTNLSIGQKLIIPSNNTSLKYTVQKGDSLYSISKKFNTTVDNIISKNNLKSNILIIGQILDI